MDADDLNGTTHRGGRGDTEKERMTGGVRTIALVDWNWTGHHPTYFAHFASALAELGARVLPICAAPDALPGLLDATPAGQSEAARARIEPPQPLTPRPLGRIQPRALRPALWAIRHFGGLGRRLRAWERASGSKIDLVFFACIYDGNFEWLRCATPFFRYPWSGLYLHARSFRMPGTPIPYVGGLPCPEKFLTLPSLHSAAVLDEGGVKPMQALAPGRRVIAFPDFADVRLPSQDDPAWGLARKIQDFARGRPVVSLVGHLQRTKGLMEFTRAAQDESLRGLFFFLGGEVNWLEIPADTREALRGSWERSPNVFTHLQRIGDERALNAVIATSDVTFAAYTDFPNSSNILTKAAFFERPVIVSDGYLMAERTRAYRLGEVVPERDMGAIKASLRRLGGLDPAAGKPQPGRWQEYRSAHSYERLVEAFAELLGLPTGTAAHRTQS
jgi:hypothetical protein